MIFYKKFRPHLAVFILLVIIICRFIIINTNNNNYPKLASCDCRDLRAKTSLFLKPIECRIFRINDIDRGLIVGPTRSALLSYVRVSESEFNKFAINYKWNLLKDDYYIKIAKQLVPSNVLENDSIFYESPELNNNLSAYSIYQFGKVVLLSKSKVFILICSDN